MFFKKKSAYEVSEQEFDELTADREDTVYLSYDEHTGVINENGYVDLDRDDEDYFTCDFGPHYMIKSVRENGFTIDSMMDILDKLPSNIGMHPITRPCVLKSSATEDSLFLSGIVIIAESHISMHFNTKTKELYMDVFSCKEISDIENYDKIMNAVLGDDFSNVLIKRGSRDKQRQETQQNLHDRHIDWQKTIGYWYDFRHMWNFLKETMTTSLSKKVNL